MSKHVSPEIALLGTISGGYVSHPWEHKDVAKDEKNSCNSLLRELDELNHFPTDINNLIVQHVGKDQLLHAELCAVLHEFQYADEICEFFTRFVQRLSMSRCKERVIVFSRNPTQIHFHFEFPHDSYRKWYDFWTRVPWSSVTAYSLYFETQLVVNTIWRLREPGVHALTNSLDDWFAIRRSGCMDDSPVVKAIHAIPIEKDDFEQILARTGRWWKQLATRRLEVIKSARTFLSITELLHMLLQAYHCAMLELYVATQSPDTEFLFGHGDLPLLFEDDWDACHVSPACKGPSTHLSVETRRRLSAFHGRDMPPNLDPEELCGIFQCMNNGFSF
jgi:hypothetical protein